MSYASGSVGAKNRPVKCNIFFFRVRKDFKIKVFLGFFWSFSDAFRLSYCIFIHYLNDVEKKKNGTPRTTAFIQVSFNPSHLSS